jgi:eukaryotic-like serine/threonine-protein kinase
MGRMGVAWPSTRPREITRLLTPFCFINRSILSLKKSSPHPDVLMNGYKKMSDNVERNRNDRCDMTLIGNRYQIDKVLAEGGMSILYAGRDVRDGSPVVIKRPRLSQFTEAKRRRRFHREIQTAYGLRHPNIVRVLDYGDDDHSEPYLVMELLKGVTLDKELSAKRKLPLAKVLERLLPLFGALSYAHAHGIVHRDLTPANIFLCRSERGRVVPKLIDFGISTMSNGINVTHTQSVFGTMQYMSPEQVNNEPVSPATDVWAMGAVMFHCLTGVLPFAADNIAGVLNKILNEPPPDLTSIAPSIGPKFCAALERAFARSASRRYQDMHSFALALFLSARAEGFALPKASYPLGLVEPTYKRNRERLEEAVTQELRIS